MIRYEENRNYIAECNFCGLTKKFKLPENNSLIFISKPKDEVYADWYLTSFYGWKVWKSEYAQKPNCCCGACKNLILHEI